VRWATFGVPDFARHAIVQSSKKDENSVVVVVGLWPCCWHFSIVMAKGLLEQ
jgi:hypothetical protein